MVFGVFDLEVIVVQLVIAWYEFVVPISDQREGFLDLCDSSDDLPVLSGADLLVLTFLSRPHALEVVANGIRKTESDRVLFVQELAQRRENSYRSPGEGSPFRRADEAEPFAF